jgi:REP element-mobilizing transposase RayT
MRFVPRINHRKSIRLQGYDYAQVGAYFVTTLIHQRECLLGDIVDSEMRYSAFGKIVEEEWKKSAHIRREVELDEYVVMPNHFHAIVWIIEPSDNGLIETNAGVGATGRSPLQARSKPRGPGQRTLGALMAGFKSKCTVRINAFRETPGKPVWQRNYYEHVIRNDQDLTQIREYILENPARWTEDEEY